MSVILNINNISSEIYGSPHKLYGGSLYNWHSWSFNNDRTTGRIYDYQIANSKYHDNASYPYKKFKYIIYKSLSQNCFEYDEVIFALFSIFNNKDKYIIRKQLEK